MDTKQLGVAAVFTFQSCCWKFFLFIMYHYHPPSMYPVSFVDPLLYLIPHKITSFVVYSIFVLIFVLVFGVSNAEQLGSDQRRGKKNARGERPTSSIMANALDVVERLGNGMVVVLVVSDLVHFVQVKLLMCVDVIHSSSGMYPSFFWVQSNYSVLE